ncbi:50S ribosomal protein L3 [bacterium]|nr:50S ribosomal protein L3 [bacterium]NCQ55056.1 50S ribosomal protein L3 [Candidatus Parcubacteria bacterium]NCS67100.1 50S ribosomal protein L3 [Candidatus Peregrinibacteria bacterium]NCS96046.1 50S ribosomal protein L3 [bacterium]
MKGILARKIGMSRLIDPETGRITAVTVLEAPEAKVLQIKTTAKDGYDAAVLASFERNKTRKNANKNYKFVQELRLDADAGIKAGEGVGVGSMEGVSRVKITATSKGKGFAGVIKRHNFSRGPETHGSHHHREPGSVGTCAKPARIMKGKKMPGRLGGKQTTLRNVEVVQIDAAKNLIALKGAVPGAKNSLVFIREDA